MGKLKNFNIKMKPANKIVVKIDKISTRKYRDLIQYLEKLGFDFYAESDEGDTYPIKENDLKAVFGV